MEVGGVGVRIGGCYDRGFGKGGVHDKSIRGAFRTETGIGSCAPQILHLEGEAGCNILTIGFKDEMVEKFREVVPYLNLGTSDHNPNPIALMFQTKVRSLSGSYNTLDQMT